MSANFELRGTDRWPSIVQGITHGPYRSLTTEHPDWLAGYLDRFTEDEYGITQEQYIEQLESEWQYDQTSEAVVTAEDPTVPNLRYHISLLVGNALKLWEHWPLTPEGQLEQTIRYNDAIYTPRPYRQ